MWKFAKRIAAVFFVLVLAASLAILCLCMDAEAQSVTGKKFTVVFRFKPKPMNEAADPEIRIYVLVDGKTDGDAVINAYRALSEKLTAQSTDRLEYVESQAK